MTQMLLREPEQEENQEIQDLIINHSEDRLRNFLIETIEISRFNRIFKFGNKGGDN